MNAYLYNVYECPTQCIPTVKNSFLYQKKIKNFFFVSPRLKNFISHRFTKKFFFFLSEMSHFMIMSLRSWLLFNLNQNPAHLHKKPGGGLEKKGGFGNLKPGGGGVRNLKPGGVSDAVSLKPSYSNQL